MGEQVIDFKLSHTRFNGTDWYGQTREVTVGGVGTIGSWLSVLLARTGDHTIIMYDDDEVALENLAGQLYGKDHVGKDKVEATAQLLLGFTEIDEDKVHMYNSRIEKDTYVSPVCFSCFDNMKARRTMYEEWKKRDDHEIFIDGRMTVENYQVYTVTPENQEAYEATLFDDSELPEQICSLKSTSHTGALIAGRMITSFMNHLANKALNMPIRDVPFQFREDMPMQLITIES